MKDSRSNKEFAFNDMDDDFDLEEINDEPKTAEIK